MTFKDTSHINLKVMLFSVSEAEKFVSKFADEHAKEQSSFTPQMKKFLSLSDTRKRYIGLANLYQKLIIPKLEKDLHNEAFSEVKEKWKRDGKETHYKNSLTGVMETVMGFAPEVNKLFAKKKKTNKKYLRRTAEQTRLSSADNILKGGPVETSEPSDFDLGGDGVKTKCVFCGIEEEFDDDRHINHNGSGPYACSKKCLSQWLYHKKALLWCVNCGKEEKWFKGITTWVALRGTKINFCSKDCHSKWSKSYTPPPHNPLKDAINGAIFNINNALLQEPEVKITELDSENSDFLSKIQNATSEKEIQLIRDRVLADIRIKREAKSEQNGLDELIREGQAAVTRNDLAKLKELLEKINSYHDTEVYLDKVSEIRELEKHLFKDNIVSFRESVIDSLKQSLEKDPKLLIEELTDINRNFEQVISSSISQEEIEKIKASVFDNIEEQRTKKIYANLLKRISLVGSNSTEEEISSLQQEIFRLSKSKTKWGKKIYEKNKEKLENFLFGAKDQPTESNPIEKGLFIALIVAGVGTVIFAVLLLIRRPKSYRSKK